jgi:hypothetical protein
MAGTADMVGGNEIGALAMDAKSADGDDTA